MNSQADTMGKNFLAQRRKGAKAPDYEVEIMPSAWRTGRDPQLKKAVELAMDALKKTKTPRSKRPSYPVYK